MKEKFLPIGTVVLLKDGNKKVMITSYLIFSTGNSENKKMFDYGACTFPEGIIESDYAVAFNHEEIKEIVHMGHEDEDQKNLNELLKKSAADVKAKFENGEL